MTKKSLKGVFKKVDTLYECDIVLIMLEDDPYHNIFMTKKGFKDKILDQPDVEKFVLRYLKYTNPRHASNNLPRGLLNIGFYK